MEVLRELLFCSLCQLLIMERARVKFEFYDEAGQNERLRQILQRSNAQIRELIKKMHRSRSAGHLTEEEVELRGSMDMALCDGLCLRLIAEPQLERERLARAIAEQIVR